MTYLFVVALTVMLTLIAVKIAIDYEKRKWDEDTWTGIPKYPSQFVLPNFVEELFKVTPRDYPPFMMIDDIEERWKESRAELGALLYKWMTVKEGGEDGQANDQGGE